MNLQRTTATLTCSALVAASVATSGISSASASGGLEVASASDSSDSISVRAKKKRKATTKVQVRQLTPYQMSPFKARLRITITASKEVRTKQRIRVYRPTKSRCIANAATPKVTWKRIATKTVRFKGKTARLNLTTKFASLRFVAAPNSKLKNSARTWQFEAQSCEMF